MAHFLILFLFFSSLNSPLQVSLLSLFFFSSSSFLGKFSASHTDASTAAPPPPPPFDAKRRNKRSSLSFSLPARRLHGNKRTQSFPLLFHYFLLLCYVRKKGGGVEWTLVVMAATGHCAPHKQDERGEVGRLTNPFSAGGLKAQEGT